MAKISTYPGADVPLQLSDRLIGTEAIRPIPTSTPLATKNFSLGELLQLFSSNFPAASLQAVLDTGNTATQNINLIGTIDTTLIRPDNIEDTSGSQGLTFQFLSKGASSINWVDLPVDNLQQVLNAGNTATQNITLIGNITSTKIIPGNIQDDTLGIGTTGQILSKTATGIRWINNPTVFTPGLADVLSVGNTATNDITLIGNIIATKAIPTNIQDETASIGSSGQILSKTALGIRWINNSSSITPSPLTKVDDTNVTLTLGGTPATSLLQAVSLTLGWTGTLADSRITSASNWNTAYNNRITSLTTTGTGPATLISNVLNIPTPSTPPLETITEGGNTGIAIRGRNPLNYGNIGSNAVDLSYSSGASSTRGATGLNSYAEGSDNTASGQYSHAEGVQTTASGNYSHTEGLVNTASGTIAHAEGHNNIASGYASHAEGYNNRARSFGEHAGGVFGTDYTSIGNSTDRIFNIGNGDSNAIPAVRSDAFSVYLNGAAKFFRATLASITNASAGFFIFDSGNSNRPTIHNGTAWKALAYTDDITTGVTSVGLTMPSAFTVTNSPITSSGDIAVTGAGTVSQYVRGDGTLANFPNSTGGGASVSYYLNGSISQGTFGGDTYYQMSKTPILGTGTNFTRTNGAGNGYIASFITDAGDPSFLNIPGGNWNLEFYFQSSASGGSPQFYGEIYKVSATNVFTLVASGSANPEGITQGTVIDQYFTSISVPQTSLLVTDRLAIRIYVITGGRTITLHTENGNLCQVITTFTTGLTALNGLTQQVQYFATGTSGTDFNISSVTDTHTFNLPSASAIARGVITTGTQTIAGAKTLSTAPILSSLTASQLLALDASKNIQSLDTATYPSLTELARVKGVTSAIQTQLDALKTYNYKNTTSSSTLTGTLTETQLLQVTIPANTFSASDFFKFNALFVKTGTLGTLTLRAKVSTSSTMPSGAFNQIAMFTSTVGLLTNPLVRINLAIKSGNLTGLNFNASANNDSASNSNGILSVAFDVTVTQYFYLSATLSNAADSVYLNSTQITNI